LDVQYRFQISNLQTFTALEVFAPSKIMLFHCNTFNLSLLSEFMQVNGGSKGGLNELLTAMLHNENKDIPYNELIELLHRIEDDATEIYHTKYGSDDTKIKFNINSNEKESDFAPLGRQSAKSLECIRKSIKKNLYLMKESMRTEFEEYLILCGECTNLS
jgi:hypothetical protein